MTEANIFTNFKQFGVPTPEIVRCCSSRAGLGCFRGFRSDRTGADTSATAAAAPAPAAAGGVAYDAIVCDPPYGIRAGARKEGSKRAAVKAIPADKRHDHIPQTQPYGATELMTELLDNAARLLRPGGRLVYLLPCTSDFLDAELPVHPCLRVAANCEQRLTVHLSRRLVTMVKDAPYDPARSDEYMAFTTTRLEAGRALREKQEQLLLEHVAALEAGAGGAGELQQQQRISQEGALSFDNLNDRIERIKTMLYGGGGGIDDAAAERLIERLRAGQGAAGGATGEDGAPDTKSESKGEGGDGDDAGDGGDGGDGGEMTKTKQKKLARRRMKIAVKRLKTLDARLTVTQEGFEPLLASSSSSSSSAAEVVSSPFEWIREAASDWACVTTTTADDARKEGKGGGDTKDGGAAGGTVAANSARLEILGRPGTMWGPLVERGAPSNVLVLRSHTISPGDLEAKAAASAEAVAASHESSTKSHTAETTAVEDAVRHAAQVTVAISPGAYGEQAGLLLYGGDGRWVKLVVEGLKNPGEAAVVMATQSGPGATPRVCAK